MAEHTHVADPELAEMAERAYRLRKNRQIKMTAVGEQYLGEVVLGLSRMRWPELPQDAVYLGAHLDMRTQSVVLLWAHESFPPVADGMEFEMLHGLAEWTPRNRDDDGNMAGLCPECGEPPNKHAMGDVISDMCPVGGAWWPH